VNERPICEQSHGVGRKFPFAKVSTNGTPPFNNRNNSEAHSMNPSSELGPNHAEEPSLSSGAFAGSRFAEPAKARLFRALLNHEAGHGSLC